MEVNVDKINFGDKMSETGILLLEKKSEVKGHSSVGKQSEKSFWIS